MKYKLTDDKISLYGRTLYRIKATDDYHNGVKCGELGGFVESEKNLSGDAWIFGNAKVFDNAEVSGNAKVFGNAEVFGNAKVFDNAEVFGNAKVFDNAKIGDYAEVSGNAKVGNDVKVFGNAEVSDYAWIFGYAKVFGNAKIGGYAKVFDNADYIIFKNWWSSGRYFTWTRSDNMWTVGCFHGTGKELIVKAYQDSKFSGREYERIVNYVESIINNGNEKQ